MVLILPYSEAYPQPVLNCSLIHWRQKPKVI